MSLLELLARAGDGLKHQRLDGAFVSMRQKKDDAEVTFATEKEVASQLARSVMTGKAADYVGIVLWVPATAWEAALAQPPAAPDSAKDGARLDWLENGPCNRIEALPLNGTGPIYRWHLFDSTRKDPSQSLNSVRAAIDAAMAATPPKATP